MGTRVTGKHRRAFKPGDLAWICYHEWGANAELTIPWDPGRTVPTLRVQRGSMVTIVRPARIGDYSPYARRRQVHDLEGVSWARVRAEREWLVLTPQGFALAHDDELRMRPPRKRS